jgi:hypothetical protein
MEKGEGGGEDEVVMEMRNLKTPGCSFRMEQ